jgi:O-antigen biosynthesis protein
MDHRAADRQSSDFSPTVACKICGSPRLEPYRMRSDGVNVLRCLNCGMGMVQEHPADLARLYNDAYYTSENGSANGYADYSLTAEHGVAWAASLIRLLAPHGRILDIGCADGHLLKKLQLSHDCYGIEVNPKMAALCRSAGIEIIGSDIYDPTLGKKYKGSFDVVSAVAVFEHLCDLKAAVRIALDLLRSNGILLFEVPLMSSQHSSDIWFKSSLEHIYYPNEESLKYLFERILDAPLIGNEVVIEDYGSTFIGLVPKDRGRGKELLEQYNNLFHRPISELKKPDERRFRFLLDCVHAARTTPEHLDLVKDLDLIELNSALFQRLTSLWRRDADRRDAVVGELRHANKTIEEQQAELRQQQAELRQQQAELRQQQAELHQRQAELHTLSEEKERLLATITEQENELQIFRTSKLQRLRSTILYERFSLRKLMKIAYLGIALATPKPLRNRLRLAIQQMRPRLKKFTHQRANIQELKNEPWPADKPLVSVIIPCFNYGRYVEEAVDSVLSQTFQDFEIIVVDGGSTDSETIAVMRSFQKPKTTVYLREGRHLVGDNRNFGINRARGKYICCLDADDKLKPTYLEKALFLLENYAYDLVSTSVQHFGASELDYEVPPNPSLDQITKYNQFSTVAVFSKSLWHKARGYHDWGVGEEHVSEDWDLWVRMMALGARATNIPETLMLYRRHHCETLSTAAKAPPLGRQIIQICHFNKKLLSRRNHRLSEKRNAAIVEVDDPFKNIVNRDRRESTKPSLLFALPFVITGGADTVLLGVAEYLAANSFELSVITTIPTDATLGDNTPRYEAITKQIYHLPKFLQNQRHWRDFLFYLIASRQMDVLFLAGSAFVYDLLPEIKERFPHLRVVDQLFNEFGHIENNRKYSQQIDLHVVANETIKKVLIERFGEDPNRIRVVVHGVDVKHRFNPENTEVKPLASPALLQDKFVVSFIGRFSEEKCPSTFVKIADRLRNEENLHFVMIGNGPEYQGIKREIAARQLEHKVYSPGFVPEMRPYVKISGVVVIPSRIEGIPIILMESLALGVPVVASNVGGIPSIVRDGFNGFVCESSDIEGFVKRIRQIAADDRLRNTLRANARQSAVQHLDVDNTNREYHDLLLALIRGENPQNGAFRDAALNGSPDLDESRAGAMGASV